MLVEMRSAQILAVGAMLAGWGTSTTLPAAVGLLAGATAGCGASATPAERPTSPEPEAPLPSSADIEDLVVSATGSCARLRSGGALCWGAWDSSLIKVSTAAAGLRDVAELRVGHDIKLDPQRYYDHLCYRDPSGRAFCWGNNQQRQLGDGLDDSPTPTQLESLPPVAQLALGKRHSCALTRSGEVLCWGSNEFGQAGAGQGVETVKTPLRVVDLPTVTQLVTGASHTCALTEDKRVFCWGSNFNDQCDGIDDNPVVVRMWQPNEIARARGVSALASGSSTVCGLTPDGAICWGFVRDFFGDDHERRSSAVLSLPGTTALGLGDSFGCALSAAGEVRCFGKGPLGELGNGQESPTTTPPTPVALPDRAVAIAVGPHAACARVGERGWWCWGANKGREIGPRGVSPILAPRLLDPAELELVGR